MKPLQTPSKMVNGFDPSTMGKLTAPTRNAVNRRNRLLGPAYRLFYQKPLEVDHGQGVHLYDKQGYQYLDAYNNVVSVGHAHPRVVQAVSKQMATLCTFIADSLFSSDGIFSQPTDLLRPVAEVVREAGGLFVADEVQSGFARSGERLWGFQGHGIDPGRDAG
jgi:4-aminobutyrate aminotransferase-like enzyme